MRLEPLESLSVVNSLYNETLPDVLFVSYDGDSVNLSKIIGFGDDDHVMHSAGQVELLLDPVPDLLFAQRRAPEFQHPRMIPKGPAVGDHFLELRGKLFTWDWDVSPLNLSLLLMKSKPMSI